MHIIAASFGQARFVAEGRPFRYVNDPYQLHGLNADDVIVEHRSAIVLDSQYHVENLGRFGIPKDGAKSCRFYEQIRRQLCSYERQQCGPTVERA